MSSEKERQILERQRLLAARLNLPGTSSSVPIASDQRKKTPATKTPYTCVSSKAIDLTKPNKTMNGKTQENSYCSQARPSPNPAPAQDKKPVLKRPTTAKSASATLAAVRAKASNSSSGTETGIKRKPPPSLQPTCSYRDTDTKPSPRVRRKTAPPSQASSLISGASSLASLVKHVSMGNDDAMAQSLVTHKPDDFWKIIREWDLPSQYYHEMQQQQSSANGGDPLTNNAMPARKPLPNTFLNARHYIAAWAPLCMAECRSQLLQEVVQNMTAPVLVEVQSTSSRVRHRRDHGAGDDAPWLQENETGGHVVVCPKNRETMNFMANDIVLLVQPGYKDILRDISQGTAVQPNGSDPDSATVFAGISLTGHTESARRELNGLILKVSRRKWAVCGKKEMYLVKVGSNVTALREFTALCNIDTLPMKQFLLGQHLEKAENRRKLSRNQPIEQLLHQMGGAQLGDGFLNYASKKFNLSQLTAIAAAAHEYGEGGFTLIKGPPGTGSESRRLVGNTRDAILSSLLHFLFC